MHGFPAWFLYAIAYWPLIVGIVLGVIGQLVWVAVR